MSLPNSSWSVVGNGSFAVHCTRPCLERCPVLYGLVGLQVISFKEVATIPLHSASVLVSRPSMQKSQAFNWCHFARGSLNWPYPTVSIPKNPITHIPHSSVELPRLSARSRHIHLHRHSMCLDIGRRSECILGIPSSFTNLQGS